MEQSAHVQLHERRRATRTHKESLITGGENMKRVFLLLMAVVLTIHTSPSASAHSKITSLSPRQNSVLTELPKSVTIKFSEAPLTFKKKKVNLISVSNPRKEMISVGETKVVGKSLIVALSDQEAVPGRYLVTYRMASPDGHVVTGSYRFTLTSS
jgi:methionine-rich copper-binding protein CopC